MSGDPDENTPNGDPEEASEAYLQALEQIQNIIERQANNSFKIKGWTVTLVVGVIVFRTGDYETLLGYIPLFSFWYLDSYYLKQERKFRMLYNCVRTNQYKEDSIVLNMNPSAFTDKTESKRELMFSDTERWFYGMIGVLLLAIFLLSICTSGSDVNIVSHLLSV